MLLMKKQTWEIKNDQQKKLKYFKIEFLLIFFFKFTRKKNNEDFKNINLFFIYINKLLVMLFHL